MVKKTFLAFLLFATLASAAVSVKCGGNEVCIFTGLKASSGLSTGRVSSFVCPVDGVIIKGVLAGTRDGVEISVPEGLPVKAAADGLVVEAEFDASRLGHYVKVQHSENPDVFSVYGYLSERSVRQKDRVKKGEKIGKSGHTGKAEQSSVYFEIRRGTVVSREPESVCPTRAAEVTAAAPKDAPVRTPSYSGYYDVSSRSQFSTGNVRLAGIGACVKETEGACPSTGTANHAGRTWKTADRHCVFKKASALYQVPYSLLKSVMAQESGGNQFAQSAYAYGYTQMIPETAAGMGIGMDRIFDPYYNICGGVEYLARQLKAFGSVECALAAYNAGPYDYQVQTKDPKICANHRYAETANYVRSISAMWERNIGVA